MVLTVVAKSSSPVVPSLSSILNRYPDRAIQERGVRHPHHYADYVLGASFFDLDGLPRASLHTGSDGGDANWVQATFEALRLQSLLGCWLKLRGVEHVTIRGSECNIVLVRQRDRYIGLLVKQDAPIAAMQALIQWAKEFRRKV